MRLDELFSERTHADPTPHATGFGVFVLALILLITGLALWSQLWARIFAAAVEAIR